MKINLKVIAVMSLMVFFTNCKTLLKDPCLMESEANVVQSSELGWTHSYEHSCQLKYPPEQQKKLPMAQKE